MPETAPQSYKSHAKIDPVFHFFLMPVALATLIAAIRNFIGDLSLGTGWMVVVALAFLLLVFRVRVYSLKVQNRLIRLEERLRMRDVLPATQHSRIHELTESQLIALRFAPDSELPALVDQTLTNNWKAPDIKKAIGTWRPDHYRV